MRIDPIQRGFKQTGSPTKLVTKPVTKFAKLLGKDGDLTVTDTSQYHHDAVEAENSFLRAYHSPHESVNNRVNEQRMKQVTEISSMYGQLLGLTVASTRATLILAEVHVLRSRWLRIKREGSIFPSSVEETAKECDMHLYPYVSSLLDIFISLPATVASTERCFSTLRKLKTWLRGQMGQTRLSGLALLNVHCDIDISIDRVINRVSSGGIIRVFIRALAKKIGSRSSQQLL
ncbi:hypothetical protein QYM36_010119 [Artemia franciscana]|uniref:HAT C-terminal dimerisation domain-containing protein n=1 Tax=Artemia franciscana TaxID=6661 RepID=A0AA88HZR4_ARTSF|nr:hypothetical protein QYM36_010119 [Artemia franciscana]